MNKITSFDFEPGDILVGKYEIISRLGAGWEGEVYKIRERVSGIERTAKLFYPHRNKRNKNAKLYAQKLHKLRQCQMLIHYHTEETLYIDGTPNTILISEYVEGALLSDFIKTFPGKKLTVYQGLHLLYAIARGIEEIHLFNEYHGDLHAENVIINRYGIVYDVKLLDMFHWGAPTKANRDEDVIDLIRIFYDAIGGANHYAKLPQEAKDICCGLKRSLILKKFRSTSGLREYLEKVPLSNQVR